MVVGFPTIIAGGNRVTLDTDLAGRPWTKSVGVFSFKRYEHALVQKFLYCSDCGKSWHDCWGATCDDDCPRCGARHMSPCESDDLSVIVDRVRDQMLARDLDLLVLGVTGDADDLHAVHQGRRDVERVRRRDEHHVGEIIVDLEIVVVEGLVIRTARYRGISRIWLSLRVRNLAMEALLWRPVSKGHFLVSRFDGMVDDGREVAC